MRKFLVLIGILFTAGCFNLATEPSQITGVYVPDTKYRGYSCEDLAAEASSLARRENQLVAAQAQRRSSSQIQAFWIGYGSGDGIEASELASVRGEREAVRRAMDKLGCDAYGTSRSARRVSAPGKESASHIQQDLETIEEWRKKGLITDQEAQSLRMELLEKY